MTPACLRIDTAGLAVGVQVLGRATVAQAVLTAAADPGLIDGAAAPPPPSPQPCRAPPPQPCRAPSGSGSPPLARSTAPGVLRPVAPSAVARALVAALTG
ncbi:hypothetical protein ACGF8B_10505 [Streptomyces sp. NPDC047917]|uniref:hypothetical protein n=1 Tax=Streptomyces sp. NPDC047917 TaxID=3365491 RepID=UPI0037133193